MLAVSNSSQSVAIVTAHTAIDICKEYAGYFAAISELG
jgi:hypothetical protein